MRDPFVKLRLTDARKCRASMPEWGNLSHGRALDAAISAAEKLSDRKKARPVPLAHPKPDPKDGKAKRARSKDEQRQRIFEIRKALARRSMLVGDWLGEVPCEKCRAAIMADPHHLFGRGKGRPLESERNCVGLCRRCHEWMQHPPTLEAAAEGWDWAGRHLEALGFGEEAAMCWARAKKCRTRVELSRAGEAVRAVEVSRE